jgi:hypothetical protein
VPTPRTAEQLSDIPGGKVYSVVLLGGVLAVGLFLFLIVFCDSAFCAFGFAICLSITRLLFGCVLFLLSHLSSTKSMESNTQFS